MFDEQEVKPRSLGVDGVSSMLSVLLTSYMLKLLREEARISEVRFIDIPKHEEFSKCYMQAEIGATKM